MAKNWKKLLVITMMNVFAWASIFCEGSEARVIREFTSPDHTNRITVLASPTQFPPGPPIITLALMRANGDLVELKETPKSEVNREIHGTSFLQDESTKPLWIDNRFAVFQDEFGLVIVDAQQQRILLRSNFESLVKTQNNRWVAIRYRSLGRNQNRLEDDFQDTLLFMNPYTMSARLECSTEHNPFGHVEEANVGGIILGGLNFSKDHHRLGVLVWKQKSEPEGVLFDPQTARVAGRIRVKENVPDGRFMLDGRMKAFAPASREILMKSGLLNR